MTTKKTYRIEETLSSDIASIAEEKNLSENAAVEEALKFYRDYMYMKDKATIINEEILKVNKAGIDLLEQRVNNKTNQVLSELAIQMSIMTQVIAGSLQIDPLQLPECRKKAVEFLRANNRVFRLDELIE